MGVPDAPSSCPQWRRDVVTETKIVELVIVADHAEVSWPGPGCPPLASDSRATFPGHFS